jgi:hypothetical protein
VTFGSSFERCNRFRRRLGLLRCFRHSVSPVAFSSRSTCPSWST